LQFSGNSHYRIYPAASGFDAARLPRIFPSNIFLDVLRLFILRVCPGHSSLWSLVQGAAEKTNVF